MPSFKEESVLAEVRRETKGRPDVNRWRNGSVRGNVVKDNQAAEPALNLQK